MITTRRLFMGAGAASLIAACSRPTTAPAAIAEAAPVGVPGIQLYTVRDAMTQDFVGTLQRIAEIGYKDLEFAGYFDQPPAEVKRIVADLGMSTPSTHVNRTLIRDDPMPSIEAGAAIGHKYLVLNWLAPEERQTLDQYRAWADTVNSFAEQCRAAGMMFAWHNHDFELTAIDGIVPYDILLERCDPSLVKFELDLYWARKAGVDLDAFLTQHGARIPMVHVKDMDSAGAMADVGTGTIDFASLFAKHKLEHYFAERDDAPDQMASAGACFTGLSAALQGAQG